VNPFPNAPLNISPYLPWSHITTFTADIANNSGTLVMQRYSASCTH